MPRRGFTLIELMIVVAVVAILATIAYPSFNEQIRQSRRADAFSGMGDVQLQLERHRADNPSYDGADPVFPTSSHYDFAFEGDARSYEISATPKGAQASDRCGTLFLKYDADDGGLSREADKEDCIR